MNMKRLASAVAFTLLAALAAVFCVLYGMTRAELLELRHAMDVEVHNRARAQAAADVFAGDLRRYVLSHRTQRTDDVHSGFTVWEYNRQVGRPSLSPQFAEAYVLNYNDAAAELAVELGAAR